MSRSTTHPETLGRGLVRGVSWTVVQIIAARALTFAGQLVLGWLLVPEDYGLYATALGVTTLVSALRNGGAAQLLVRNVSEDPGRYRQIAGIAYLSNAAAAAALVAAAPFIAAHQASAELSGLLGWLAASFVLGTPAAICKGQLIVSGRHGSVTTLALAGVAVWQCLTIAMAWAGWGAYSYVVPLAVQALFESVLGLWLAGRSEAIRPVLRKGQVAGALQESGWLMLGSAALSLATSGDYLAISLFEPPATVGQYFFAFQLVMAVGVVVTAGLEAILPGIVSRLEAEPARQSEALLRLADVTARVAMPVAAALHLCAPWLVQVLWQGRWNAAGEAVALLALCIPAWVLMCIARAVLEGRGHWGRRFALLLVYGVGAVSASFLGARFGSLELIVKSVTSFYLIFGACLLVLLSSLLRVPVAALAMAIGPPAACALMSMVVGTQSIPWALGALAVSSVVLLRSRLLQVRDILLQRKSA